MVQHGMGTPSMSIMLNELLKLLHYAKATNVCMFRVGTSGGLGCAPGSVVISRNVIMCETALYCASVKANALPNVLPLPDIIDVA
jgi:uridine phosphorylase